MNETSSAEGEGKKKRRRIIINLLRIIFSVALLYVAYRLIQFEDLYLVKHGDVTLEAQEVHEEGTQYRIVVEGTEQRLPRADTTVEFRPGFLSLFRKMDKVLFLALLPLFGLSVLSGTLRWFLLLRANGFQVGFGTVLKITYIGVFFNNFLPGSVGGDISRALIAAKGKERKAALVGTILLDRLIGLGAMILLAVVCVIPYVTDPTMRFPVLFVGSLLAAMILGYLVYFNKRLRKIGFVGRLRGSRRFGSVIQDLDGALKTLRDRKGTVAFCAGLSLFAQSIIILWIFGMARAIGVTQVSLLQFFIFEPIIFMISAAPVSAGGWGVQEGAYAFLFGKVGVPANQAIAISVLYKLTLIMVSLPGGILFALGGARQRDESGSDSEVGRPTGDVPAHERTGDGRAEH